MRTFFFNRRPYFFVCFIGLAAVAVQSDAPYPVLRERYDHDILKDPGNYVKRLERAALILDNATPDDIVKTDIDTLLAHAEWKGEGEYLAARSLYVQGRLNEAKVVLQKNLHGRVRLPEQARLLAAIELSEKDTVGALKACRMAWDNSRDENDYVVLLELYRGRGAPPEKLLQQGLQLYPQSAGVVQTVFEVYFAAKSRSSLKRSLAVSARAADTLWPLSVDWKIRRAMALLALKRRGEAETVLLKAMDLLDDDLRLQGENGEAFRNQIFKLLDEARASAPPRSKRR